MNSLLENSENMKVFDSFWLELYRIFVEDELQLYYNGIIMLACHKPVMFISQNNSKNLCFHRVSMIACENDSFETIFYVYCVRYCSLQQREYWLGLVRKWNSSNVE